MENGVKILIERIKTNPEEFGETGDRWSRVVGKFRQFMSAEDRVALDEALRPILMEKFNEEVLNTLMRTEQEQEQGELDFGAGNGGSTITLTTKRRMVHNSRKV
jgi:hypothetical protein